MYASAYDYAHVSQSMTRGFFLTNDAFPQIIKPCTETGGNTAAISVRGRRWGHAHQLQSGSMLANLLKQRMLSRLNNLSIL